MTSQQPQKKKKRWDALFLVGGIEFIEHRYEQGCDLDNFWTIIIGQRKTQIVDCRLQTEGKKQTEDEM